MTKRAAQSRQHFPARGTTAFERPSHKKRPRNSAAKRPALEGQRVAEDKDKGHVHIVPVRSSIIFDVEGTLVDCAFHVTECWRQTLETFGHPFSNLELHKYSGMDTDEMLNIVLPEAAAEEKDRIKAEQDRRYRELFLPNVKAVPRVRSILRQLRRNGHRIALATTCKRDELTAYLDLTGAGDFIDTVACGEDNVRGKPHPDLFRLALGRLGARKDATAVGDTPYDAIAASRAGIRTIGTLTGGFSEQELADAGCYVVIDRLPRLLQVA
jgi:HAD superfamily hydrolase (TIGR01549 family)